MGEYTEFHFNSKLEKETPEDIIETLKFMIDITKKVPALLPKHELFETDRWEHMLVSDSCYFDAETHTTLRFNVYNQSYYLCIRCNLKNQNYEIENFVDWIKPYLDKMEGDFLGFSRYEYTEEPELLFV